VSESVISVSELTRRFGATTALDNGKNGPRGGTQEEVMSREQRKAQLKEAATRYFDGLTKKDFDIIPYDDNVSLRAPFAPGGIHNPLVGREKLRTLWWPPMPAILGEVRVFDLYYNDDLTAVVAEAEVEVTNPKARLRVADRFTVNAAGKIVEQVNHSDPRDVTNPGWQKQEA